MVGPSIECLAGREVERHLPALAALRIEVFREYPYLYDGTLEYEARYLRPYAASPRSLVVIASDGGTIVGASTAMPLAEHGEDLVPTFEAAGYAVAEVYYFGESVLRASYRGQGLGHAFFDAREARARELGFRLAAFCAVERPAGHPRRPPDYTPHDAFWSRRGYSKRPDLRAQFSWRDLDDAEESVKPMVFWVRELAA